jgi:hypothetical protein
MVEAEARRHVIHQLDRRAFGVGDAEEMVPGFAGLWRSRYIAEPRGAEIEAVPVDAKADASNSPRRCMASWASVDKAASQEGAIWSGS